MSTKSWEVTNITPEQQSFDDKSLPPRGMVTVSALTDDLLAAWFVNRVSINPEPNKIDWASRVFCLSPHQLPLPVRMVGGFAGMFTPGEVKDVAPIEVSAISPTKIVSADNARCNFRFRNTGTEPVAFGGKQVTFATAIIVIQPGEVFDERFAPNVAWYAITETDPGEVTGFTIQI